MRPALRFTFLAALALLVAAWGCESGPGLIPGDDDNHAPRIVTSSAEILADGTLRIRAEFRDRDGDVLAVQLQQTAGPDTIEIASERSADQFETRRELTGAGTLEFRLRVSDGRASVSDTLVVAADDSLETLGPFAPGPVFRPPPTGRFAVRITGQTFADRGFEAFAIDGVLDIVTPAVRDVEDATFVPIIRLTTGPLMSHAPPGTAAFDTTLTPDRFVAFEQFGRELTWLIDNDFRNPDFGQFVTAESGGSIFTVASLFLSVDVQGDEITGQLRLSSIPLGPDEVLFAPDYDAQLTGRRIP